MKKTTGFWMWLGIVMILSVGVIHVYDAQDSFSEALYKGYLFYANGLAAAVAAWGIFRQKNWGWNLGLLIAAGSAIGYILSRTVGLPYIPAEPDAWFEPLGIASLITEGLFVLIYVRLKKKK